MTTEVSTRLASVTSDINVARDELESLKSVLKGDRESFLGLRCPQQRQPLLQLLLSVAQEVDRLREKEVELLRLERCLALDPHAPEGVNGSLGGTCDRATRIQAGSHDCQDDEQHTAPTRQTGAATEPSLLLSDVTSWVTCRTLMDALLVGDIRVVDVAAPRELSVRLNQVRHFQWPERTFCASGSSSHAAPAYRPQSDNECVSLSVYLNTYLRPGSESEWVVPVVGAGSDDDFLSVPLCNGFSVPASSEMPRRVSGAAPAAIISTCAALAAGTPSSGLRVVLVIAPPRQPSDMQYNEEPAASSDRPGAAVEEQGVLCHAIATLACANARSPLTKPIVILSDLRDFWEVMWLAPRCRDGENPAQGIAGGGDGGAGVTSDVFVWRLEAIDAASVIRTMLAEEEVTWDGEVTWAAPGSSTGYHSIGNISGTSNVNSGNRGAYGGRRDIFCELDGVGPMTSLRNRHRRGRRGASSASTVPPNFYLEMALGPGTSSHVHSVPLQGIAGEEREHRLMSAPGAIGGGHFSRDRSGDAGTGSSGSESITPGASGFFTNYYNGEDTSGRGNDDGVYRGIRNQFINPLASEPRVLKHLMSFAAADNFLFVAGVCRMWRHAWGFERSSQTSTDAAVESPSRLAWARASGCPWGSNVCARAAAGGHFATLRYARAIMCPWDWRTCAYAVTEKLMVVGNMIQWAASRPPVISPPPRHPSWRFEMLQWCRANGCPWDESTTSEAAKEGNVDILKWARANGCLWNVLTCAYAAAAGHLDILKWARLGGCPWNEATCAFAAAGGHLEILKWARDMGCPWGEETCASAARGGRLEVLKWARRNNCPWGGGTCANAAEGGHLEILQWVRQQGCPWTEVTCILAAREGHLEVLKWARQNGCPWGTSTFRAAASGGHMKTLLFLVVQGCPWDARVCASAAKGGSLETLKWLRASGCPWDSRTLDYANEVGATDVFDWAVENGCPA